MEKEDRDVYSKKSEKMDGNNKACIFITGLSITMQKNPHILKSILQSHIEGIEEVEIPVIREELPGYAYAFLSDFSLLRNVLKNNRIRINEHISLSIKPFKKGKALEKAKKDQEKRRLYITSIPADINSDNLRSVFEKYGKVEDAHVLLNQIDSTSRGVGYVIFFRKKDAERVKLQKFVPLDVTGRVCKVQKYKKALLLQYIFKENHKNYNRKIRTKQKSSAQRPKISDHSIKPTCLKYFLERDGYLIYTKFNNFRINRRLVEYKKEKFYQENY